MIRILMSKILMPPRIDEGQNLNINFFLLRPKEILPLIDVKYVTNYLVYIPN
jgi:hypothetical protein